MNLKTHNLLQNKYLIALILIIILGVTMRLYCLSCESLWLDEGFSVFWARMEIYDLIDHVLADVHPPLYFVTLHFWISFAGESEFALRLLSVIFSSLSIPLIYILGRNLFSKETGLIAAFIFSISVFSIELAQNVRGYSLLTFLSLLSMYFFIKMQERKPLYIFLYILSSTLMLYTHFFAVFLIAAQNIYLMVEYLRSKELPKTGVPFWVLTQIILFLLYLPILGVLFKQLMYVGQGEFLGWLPEPSVYLVLYIVASYSGFFTSFMIDSVSLTGIMIVILFITLFLNSIVKFNELKLTIRKRNIYELRFLLCWFSIPILTPLIISILFSPMLWPRFTVAASLAFYLLIARGIENINKKTLKIFAIILVITLSFANLWTYYSLPHQEQWRESIGYIMENGKNGDLVLVNKWYTHVIFDYYFESKQGIERILFPQWDYEVTDNNVIKLDEIVIERERVWFLHAHNGDPNKLIDERLANELNFRLIEKRDYIGIELYLYEKMNSLNNPT